MVPFRSVILISPSQEGGGWFGTRWNQYLTKKIMKMKNIKKTLLLVMTASLEDSINSNWLFGPLTCNPLEVKTCRIKNTKDNFILTLQHLNANCYLVSLPKFWEM